VKAKGEQRILYLIWHLFTRLSGESRHRTFKKKESHNNERSLDGERGSRATTCIRATGNNTIPCHRFCMRFFFFRLQSAERHSRFETMCQCANPNVLSKISDREKKKRGF
jgi:hypothetical protein